MDALAAFLQTITSLLVPAFFVEGFVEIVSKLVVLPEQYRELGYRVTAVIIGLLLAFGFNIDLAGELLAGFTPAAPWVGVLFTGLTLGLFSSLIHDKYVKKETPQED